MTVPPDEAATEKDRRSLCPIDVSETEERLIGNLWVQEMLDWISDKRIRWMVEMHVLHDMQLNEIADRLGLSAQRVSALLRGYTQVKNGCAYTYPGILEKLRNKVKAER